MPKLQATLAEWAGIAELMKTAEEAVNRCDRKILEIALAHSDEKTTVRLVELSNRLRDDGPLGLYYMCTPQSEWTGGDSSKAKNFTLREPNWVQHGSRFDKEDVDRFRVTAQ
jgi:hypothetical protein